MKRMMNRKTEVGDLFKGFNYFVPALVAALIISLFVFGGSLLCIVPGLVLSAMYNFTYLFLVDKRLDFWPAMQASHACVDPRTIISGVYHVPAGVGVDQSPRHPLCCIVGIFITTCRLSTIACKDNRGLQGTGRLRFRDGGNTLTALRRAAAGVFAFACLWYFFAACTRDFRFAPSIGSPAGPVPSAVLRARCSLWRKGI